MLSLRFIIVVVVHMSSALTLMHEFPMSEREEGVGRDKDKDCGRVVLWRKHNIGRKAQVANPAAFDSTPVMNCWDNDGHFVVDTIPSHDSAMVEHRACAADLATSSLHLSALAAVTEFDYLRNGVPSALSPAATGERADCARRRALDDTHRAHHLDVLPPAGVGRGAANARVASLGRLGSRAGIVTRAGWPFVDRRRGRDGRWFAHSGGQLVPGGVGA